MRHEINIITDLFTKLNYVTSRSITLFMSQLGCQLQLRFMSVKRLLPK